LLLLLSLLLLLTLSSLVSLSLCLFFSLSLFLFLFLWKLEMGKKEKEKEGDHQYGPEPNSTVKCVMLGGGGVGKTACTIRFCSNCFTEEYDPTIEDAYRKCVLVDEVPYIYDVLDTAGGEEYNC